MSITAATFNAAVAAIVTDINDIVTQRAAVIAAITGNMGTLNAGQQAVIGNLFGQLDREIAQTMLEKGLGPVLQAAREGVLDTLSPKDKAVPNGLATTWAARLSANQLGPFV